MIFCSKLPLFSNLLTYVLEITIWVCWGEKLIHNVYGRVCKVHGGGGWGDGGNWYAEVHLPGASCRNVGKIHMRKFLAK